MALRSKENADAYLEAQGGIADHLHLKDYSNDSEHIIRSFEYWHIISNLYPYDMIAKEHDMLVPKRVFSKLSDCTRLEWEEYKTILNVLETEGYYDAVLENFSRGRSILRHLHIHLIVWKDRYAGSE